MTRRVFCGVAAAGVGLGSSCVLFTAIAAPEMPASLALDRVSWEKLRNAPLVEVRKYRGQPRSFFGFETLEARERHWRETPVRGDVEELAVFRFAEWDGAMRCQNRQGMALPHSA